MSTPKRVLGGWVFVHGDTAWAILATKQPYDLTGYRELPERAAQLAGVAGGPIFFKIVEMEEAATEQGFVVIPKGKMSRRQMEALLRQIFPDCEFTFAWITNFRQEEGILRLGLIRRATYLREP